MQTEGTTRRDALALIGISGAAALPSAAASAPVAPTPLRTPRWGRGVEGQRKADLGTTFLNPILAGDHPDPSILRDGDDYYMTFSTFDAYPGLRIWHSRDLVNWQPLRAALTRNIGSVWAPDLCKHDGRYFIYVTVAGSPGSGNWVLWADRIDGPWSEPIRLDAKGIDPGHIVGEDGTRWLFLSGGNRVRLAPDGLSTIGELEHVYERWHYPPEWQVEGPVLEGPKLARRGGYFHMLWAFGGTAGPPTSHMVIAARSRSIDGPWEQHPANPLVHTASSAEPWWSRGHATMLEGPGGTWWGVYHGYEKGYYTLGRQTLLAPVTWADDWPYFGGGDLSQPIGKPRGGTPVPHGMALSDDFSTDRYGSQWFFFKPAADERERLSRKDGWLAIEARGTSPADSSPLVFTTGDRSYQMQCEIEVDPGARAGMLVFYDHRLYCGLTVGEHDIQSHKYGEERGKGGNGYGRRLFVRLRNEEHVVSFHLSRDGREWTPYASSFEVSGYHHNVRGGFLALRPAIYSAGTGKVRIRDFRYEAI